MKNEKKSDNKIHAWLLIALFICTTCLFTVLMVLSAFVPQEKLVDNYKESADFLCKKIVFFDEIEDVTASKIDRYADSILLNIGWHFDKSNPLTSTMKAEYYYTDYQNENNNLFDAVNENKAANLQYIRYWHGSAAVVRVLHLIFNVKQIYIFHSILLVILLIITVTLLCKRKMFEEIAAFIIGLIVVSAWFVPLSLEYTWTFICMFVVSIFVLIFKKNDEMICILFLLSGMITNYMDFLTTETLTLLVPLILLFRMNFAKFSDKKSDLLALIRNGVLWAIGYVGAWVSKWLIASFVLHENVMPYVTGHIEERLGGGNEELSLPMYCIKAVGNNLKCLFPFGYGSVGVFISLLIIFVVIYITYVYHQKNINRKNIVVYAVFGVIPIVRYMVLHNHSFYHHFFTYRAQLVGVMACCFIVFDIIDRRYFKNVISFRRKM
ncbi:MAG: hypothetical protein E7271_04070 [Lachnospiraceae bacterium]|nr:hypothetical protein [Lachnospiraceae bacterium]